MLLPCPEDQFLPQEEPSPQLLESVLFPPCQDVGLLLLVDDPLLLLAVVLLLDEGTRMKWLLVLIVF